MESLKKRFKRLKRLKVYVAGKVSGLPREEVVANFARHAAYVRQAAGRKTNIVLPINLCSPDWSWWRCMRVCLRALRTCDAIYLMPNWKKSKGARIERLVAKWYGITIVD